ncbi:MAG: TonB-dependent receptor [Flavobacteriaceae bacterium]
MRSIYIILFFILLSSELYGQECTGTLSGVVLDFHDNTPLVGATVQIFGTDKVVSSDFNGEFRLTGLCNGVLEVEVSHPECSSQFISIDIQENTFKKITLEHHLEELTEIKVIGDMSIDKSNSAQEASLKVQALERYGSGSLGDALKQISGVSSLNTGSKIVKPVIQGLHGSRVLILNNGVRMQDMEWGDEHAPNVDINAMNSVSVIKGAAALEYGGDAIGGVIVLEQARIPAIDSLYGKTLLNGATNGRGGNITSELTKSFENGWFVKGQGSYKRFGDSEAPDYVLSNTGISQIGASISFGKHLFKAGWDAYYSFFKSNIGILRASHIGNIDDLINDINSPQPFTVNEFTYAIDPPSQDVSHHLGKFKYYKRFEGLGKWNVQYDYQLNHRLEFDVRIGDRRENASLDLELTTHTLTTDFKIDANSNYKLSGGLLFRYQNNFANPDTGVRRLIPDYDKYDFGVFVTGVYYITNNLLWDAGLRYDYTRIDAKKFYQTSRWEERGYDLEFADFVIENLGNQLLTNPISTYNNISAATGLNYDFGKDSELRFNYALSQRAPNPSELFSDGLHHSAARIELGDLRIQSEASHKVSLSLQKSGIEWGYEVSPYINSITDFILLEPSGVEFTIRGAFPVWAYRQTDALLLGVDTAIYSQWTENWRTDHRFSLVKGKDLDLDSALINIPAADLYNAISYFSQGWNDLKISLNSQYVFRQNEFPDNIIVTSPELNQEVLLEINTPPDAYHLLELDAEMKFDITQNNVLSVGMTVSNVLNTTYREYLNRQRNFADDLGRNFLVRLKYNY